MISLRSLLLAGAAATLIHAGAMAQAPVSPDQAAAAETQLRDWIGGMLGSSVKLSERPVHVTPAGDHYDVRVLLVPRPAADGGDIAITATARPVEGGKWDVDNIRQTNPLRFSMARSVPDDAGGTTTATLHYNIDVQSQGGRMQLDPTLATPTTYSSSSTGLTSHTEGGPLVQDTTAGPINSVMTIRPAGPDRVDINADATAQDYHIVSRKDDDTAMDISMDRVRANFAVTGVSRAHGTMLVRTMATIISQSMAAMPTTGQPTPDAAPKVAPELLESLLNALQDFASTMVFDESVQNLSVKVEDIVVAMKEARIGLAAKSNAGLLDASMDIGVTGLGLEGLPMDGMDDLIPSVVALRPFVSGIAVNDLIQMAKNNGQQPSPEQINKLFSHGGISTGLESMLVNVGGASFAGQGKVVLTSPTALTGTGTVTAENFDDLIDKLSASPTTAQSVPALALVKGLARIVNGKLTWNINYDGAKLLVNNVDVMAMANGGPAKAPPASRPGGPSTAPVAPSAPR